MTSVQPFQRDLFDPSLRFTTVGKGELGGKARGLVRVVDEILSQVDSEEFPGVDIAVPNLTLLTTSVFDDFLEQNQLLDAALREERDDRICNAFQRGMLPAQHVGDLWALISKVHTPLAVRSSSRLEDALNHPFAGVYATKMIPNLRAETDSRFQRLLAAIKLVWASTFFKGPKAYANAVGQDLRDEKMAVIIQAVAGRRRADRFYPSVSGVARSFNYYPTGRARPEEGVVSLALGLGKTIVDGGMTWTYSPAHPKAPPPFGSPGELVKSSQNRFWAVHMATPTIPDPLRETEYMIDPDLAVAESDGVLTPLASTFDPQSNRLRPGIGGKGPRVLDFAPLLQFEVFPLNRIIRRLLEISEQVVGSAVEIEFACTLDDDPPRFSFLQVRPMHVFEEQVQLAPEDLLGDGVVLASENVLGNGIRRDICDIVYLKPERFDPGLTMKMAVELEKINRSLVADRLPYLLVGFGRWGSSDRWLGVPVEWGQVGGAQVIVEATLPNMNPDLSQGSHFFHNLLSSRVLYLSVPHQGRYSIDWDWLGEQKVVAETDFVRHVRLPRPLEVRVDGVERRGLVRHDGEE